MKKFIPYYLDAFFYSIMLGIGESFFTAYSLSLGHSALLAGLLTSAPLAIGGFFQLLVPKLLARFSSYSNWTITGAILQSITFTSIISLDSLFITSYSLLFFHVCFYWIFALGIAPSWNAWISQVISKKDIRLFLAQRNIYISIGTLLGLISAGFILENKNLIFQNFNSFKLLFLIAFIARVLSILSIYFYKRAPKSSSVKLMAQRSYIKQLPNKSEIIKFVKFSSVFKIGVFFSASFFTPYMLDSLKFSYFEYTSILLIAFCGRIVANHIIPKFKIPFNEVFLLSSIGVGLIPLIWTLNPTFQFLIILEILGGLLWGGFEYVTLVKMFELTPSIHQPSLTTFFNFYQTICIATGTILGSLCFYFLRANPNVFHIIFWLSTLLRLLSLYYYPLQKTSKVSKERKQYALPP